MTKPHVLYIDNSTLRSVAECSTAALVRYGLGLTTPEEKATLRAGTAFHEAMAEYLRTAGDVAAGMKAFAEQYAEWAEEHVSPDDRLSWGNTSRIVAAWFDMHPLPALPFTVAPEMVEIGFAFPLTAEDGCACGHGIAVHDEDGCHKPLCDCPQFTTVVFTGRLDALATSSHDGGLYVLENKSTGRINDTFIRRFRLDSQITGYTWAAEQHFGLPILGVLINAVEFSRLPSSDRKCPTHATNYAECGALHAQSKLMIVNRTPEAIVEWRRTALQLADRYRRLTAAYPRLDLVKFVRMQGTFNGGCVWCALADWCSIGRPVDLAASMLVEDRWSPFDYAKGRTGPTAHKP